MTDQGRMSLDFGGEGISLLMDWSVELYAGEHLRFVCNRAVCGIDRVDVDINNHKNRLMGNMAMGLFRNRIKKSLEKVRTFTEFYWNETEWCLGCAAMIKFGYFVT